MTERGLAWVGLTLALATFWTLVAMAVVTVLGVR